jgi:hypothetical protein
MDALQRLARRPARPYARYLILLTAGHDQN